MKFHINIELDNLAEFEWLASRLTPLTPLAPSVSEAPAEKISATHATHATHNGPVPEAPTQAPAPAPAKVRKAAKASPPTPPPANPDPAQVQADLRAGAEAAMETSLRAATAGTADIPPLDVLKNAITLTARAAMKKDGPTKILDLLPGFREATGLDFVMNATEEHRAALYDLAIQSGMTFV